ncbi:ABC transporter ATP-binding protein [Micromonospora avicenniae]|uniref:ABC-type multidrug transport system, ATPase and permease component n=1 Tax=Micromonospora avicenniae TaxID=1198245 RepID=A0A1N6Q2W8_9ACTN|nr:ABC transporter ATP-binding protein [Micromonospora avicenniae]SIQ10866.1 ABC-type multidrug transport system, ATPase and permease component [Micromonospora avicenniae]
MAAALPVADATQVRRYARTLVRRHPRALATALGLHAVAAAAGLVAPRLLGDLVEGISRGTSRVTVDRIALLIAGFVVVQAVLVRFAHLASARLGEQVLARLREEFVDRVLALPLSTVERAGTGDLLTRTSRDVSALSRTVRLAVPETLIAVVTAAFIIGALLLVSPLLALPCLIAVPVLWAGTRWYLRRAPAGYLRENAAYSDITDGISETVEGSRTTEALRQQARRRARTNADIARSYAAERYTLFLRTVFFPVAEIGYVVPVVATLVIGGWFYLKGWVSLGQVTAATLYVQQLVDPVDRLLSWLDELQVGGASMARLLGVAEPAEPTTGPAAAAARRGEQAAGHASAAAASTGASSARLGAVASGVAGPAETADGNRRLVARNVRYAYRTGRDVLHGVTLVPEPGEKLAVVGPSGAGKSTLGRLLAGVHTPHGGTVTVAGRPLDTLPLTELRSHVALVTQEHHVFIGTLRENVAMVRPAATDADVRAALSAVAALDWAQALPDGLDTLVGSGGHPLSPAQAQQLALARLVLADPHTLVLDEATSLIDPRAARELERSLAAVLAGRTVIAIAHRLFSAHDADRVAVVEDGRITELGSHDELVAANGSYAALWHSWHGTP